MSFFSNFNKKDSELDERTRLNRRKSMTTIRFIASAYVAYLAYRLFTSADESPEIPNIIIILAPFVLLAGAIFIAIMTFNEKKLIDKKIAELDAKELSENESSDDNIHGDDDDDDDDSYDDDYDDDDDDSDGDIDVDDDDDDE